MSSPPSAPSQQMGEAEEARFPDTGEVFEQKYRIENLLGAGGYAKVYKAREIDLDREVAIKVLSPAVRNVEASQSNTGSVEALAIRFEREAKMISNLRSPYTVTMFEYGRTEQDLLYMVLEYIDGVTLNDAETPMEPKRVAKILKQVLKSLHEAHSAGMLHRDLKPANIMVYEHLGENDQVKLLDFGIAKLIGESEREADRQSNQQDLTGDATLLGTPRYMAPEQIRGEDVGPGRDIYSLGLIAYEMLVGQKAITEDDSIKIMAKHIAQEPLAVPTDAGYDPEMTKIINKMLAKDVEDRYTDVAEVIEDLKRYERGLEIESYRREITGDHSAGATGTQQAAANAQAGPEEDEDDNTKIILAAVGVAALIAGGVIAVVVGFGPDKTGEPITAGSTDGVAATGPDSAASGGSEESGDDQKALAAGGSEADTGQPDTDTGAVAEATPVEVSSTPEGATISIGDEELGEAPVEFDASQFEFPATVTAEHDGQTIERELEDPDEQVSFDFSKVAADDNSRDEPSGSKTGGRAPQQEEPDEPAYGGGESTDSTGGSAPTGGSASNDEPTGSTDDEPSDEPSAPAEPTQTGSTGSDDPGADSEPSSDDSSGDDSSGSEPEFLPLE